MTDHLTYQQLRQAISQLRRTLYYATQPDIERGKAYIAKETKSTPEFIVCHPDDLSEIESTGVALKHIRSWKPKTLTDTGTTTKDILDLFEESLGEIWKDEPEP